MGRIMNPPLSYITQTTAHSFPASPFSISYARYSSRHYCQRQSPRMIHTAERADVKRPELYSPPLSVQVRYNVPRTTEPTLFSVLKHYSAIMCPYTREKSKWNCAQFHSHVLSKLLCSLEHNNNTWHIHGMRWRSSAMCLIFAFKTSDGGSSPFPSFVPPFLGTIPVG